MPATTPVPYLSKGTNADVEVIPVITGGTTAQAYAVLALTANGTIDPTMFPAGLGAEIAVATAAEALTRGDLVYFATDGIRRASAAVNGNPARGFVKTTVASGATNVSVYEVGVNDAVNGLVAGTDYYLSDTTPGGLTATPVTGAGKFHQPVGQTSSATALSFTYTRPIKLAA